MVPLLLEDDQALNLVQRADNSTSNLVSDCFHVVRGEGQTSELNFIFRFHC